MDFNKFTQKSTEAINEASQLAIKKCQPRSWPYSLNLRLGWRFKFICEPSFS